ncbi:hypothetical protein [Microscilla marina]|uniref:DUF4157 domain-containing protein n=1 Tax=Microscilla marina ATCC 23134 TaxID=313606 RepID=A1ZUE3_MICM2|nr:hypothetical protein [Microscilla marina]EAY25962.1 hypothetical protein M23134_07111 [Microscilla marina ATCC 23134]
MHIHGKNTEQPVNATEAQAKPKEAGTHQSPQGKNAPLQAKQRPLQRHQDPPPHNAKHQPVQRKAAKKSGDIAQVMGQQYGVDTSGLEFNHNSSFPGKVGAEATIQGNKIDFAPGKDSEANIKHEVGHAIDNAKHGTPKGDKVVNGQKVDTTREAAADKMMNAPLQRKEATDNAPQVGKTEGALQLKTADELLPRVKTLERYNARVLLRSGANIRLTFSLFTGYAYQISLGGTSPDKADAIKRISGFIAESGIGASGSSDFMSKKDIEALAEEAEGGIGIDRAGVTKGSLGEQAPTTGRLKKGQRSVKDKIALVKGKFEPYLVAVNCTYGKGKAKKQLTIRYNFAQESYGYVTAIIDEEVYSEMVPGGIPRNRKDRSLDYGSMLEDETFAHSKGMDQAHILNAFDQNHEKTGNRNLMDIVNQSPRNQTDAGDAASLAMHREHFDSIAKLAGEGPRFQCVRDNMEYLSSQTRFVARNTGKGGGFLAITFEDLAAYWRELGNAYDIPDSAVAAMLNHFYQNPKEGDAKKNARCIQAIEELQGGDILLRE